MIKPEYYFANHNNVLYLREICSVIDKEIAFNHGQYDYDFAILGQEFDKETRDEIGMYYKAAGWNYVYHRVSSEYGEQRGLTAFIFSMTKINDIVIIRNYHEVE